MSLKRVFPIVALAAFTLSATAVFAEEAAVPKTAPAVSSPEAKAEAPAPQQDFNLADLGIPEPTNRTCSPSSTCALVGGTPVMCTGSTCVQNANWVECDGTVHYCTCNPANVHNCADPADFCACFNAMPTNGFFECRQAFC